MTSRTMTPVYRVAANVILPIMRLVARRDWQGAEHLPKTGGFIAVGNHVTNLDAVVFAHFLYDHGAPPLFLAKHSLFEVPVFGAALRSSGQIPVHRNSAGASAALGPARKVLDSGNVLGMFPEGTFTRDPQMWPMTARTGAARLALATQVPIIPVAQWGAQDILGRYAKVPHLLPRKTLHVHAGPPVHLTDLYDRPTDPAALREATERIMRTLTGMVADIRGEQPPARMYDVRTDGDPRAAQLAAKAARRRVRKSEDHD
ncbi:lysophospholipid acyltransferase family protein [Georgenia sunbinii]|uniref:lysophospholipid acyltransferase family protein n=1 Tax=Georgenia sunbinii TaxID=3117728 RepID=UPI002F2627F6